MDLYTRVPLQQATPKITYESSIVSLGSCFAVNMATKFNRFKFRSYANPFGILFHPRAIQRLLALAEAKHKFGARDVFEHDGIWSSFDAHSDLDKLDMDQAIDGLDKALNEFVQFIQGATHVLVTFGTAWVYELKDTSVPVANCHKLPQNLFTKRLLGFNELVSSYQGITRLIHCLNPNAQIIYTVSPVRHIKDGFVENQRSKSLLISALHEYLQHFSTQQCMYFPAYEILLDELRDYRFYAKDLLHPNEIAIDYIWNQFVDVFMEQETLSVMKKVEDVTKALEHRPFNPTSEQHLKFLDTLVDKIDYLLQKYPFMNFR